SAERQITLALGWRHPTGSKLTASAISTAKSLFFCGRARKRKSGFSVPPTGGSKINRVGGIWRSFGATKQAFHKGVAKCLKQQPRTKPVLFIPHPHPISLRG